MIQCVYGYIFPQFLIFLEIILSAAEASNTILLPDLRQVIVLPKAELRRIQDELDRVDKEKESMIEEAKRRETLHLESVEVVKQWSNTLAVSGLHRAFFRLNTLYEILTCWKGCKMLCKVQ